MQCEEVGILLVSDDASQPATGQWLVSDWSVTGPALDQTETRQQDITTMRMFYMLCRYYS